MSDPIVPPNELGKALRPRFRVPPNIRFGVANVDRLEHFKIPYSPKIVVSRQVKNSTTFSTVDKAPVIHLYELVYPGNALDFEAKIAPGKWVYAFDRTNGNCIIEARREANAQHGDIWRYRHAARIEPSSLASEPILDGWSTVGVQINFDIVKEPGAIAFFLSPFRLDEKGLKLLIDRAKDEVDAGQFPLTLPWWVSPAQAYVAIVDPYAWVIAAALDFHIPTVNVWQLWIQDPERAAKVFIANILKAWIDGPIDQIKNNLWKGEPGKFLAKNKKKDDELREASEQAAAYLAACLDSPEHRAVELASFALGGTALEESLMNFGVATTCMPLTGPGRDYINALVADDSRTPMKYLFADQPPDNMVRFTNARYGYLGAKQLFGALLPAVIERRFGKGLAGATEAVRTAAAKQTAEMVMKHLNSLMEGGAELKGYDKRVMVRMKDGWQATGWQGPGGTSNPRFLKQVEAHYQRLSVVSGAAKLEAEAIQKAEDLAADFKAGRLSLSPRLAKFNSIMIPPLGLIEIANVTMAFEAWKGASGSDNTMSVGAMELKSETVGLIGAVTDAGGWVTDVMEAFGKGGLKRVGAAGALGFVSGVSEMLTHQRSFQEAALGRKEYGQSVGYAVAAGGGAVAAVGGGMALAFALSGETLFVSSAGGPIGLAVGAVGAVFIFVGFAIASLLKRDPYEQFAENCFLGDSWDDEAGGSSYDWAPSGLPLKSAVEQSKLLVMMLAAFSVRRLGAGDPWPASGTAINDDGLTWLAVGTGNRSSRWDNEIDRPNSWIRVDLGHFPVGSQLDIEITQRYGESGWFAGDALEYKTRTSFRHTSPGVLTEKLDTASSTLLLETVEFAVQTEAVRAIRFPMRPAWIGMTANKPPISWKDFALKQSCLSYVIRARVIIGGQPPLYATIPEGSRWVGFDARKDEGVSALSTGAYSS